MLEKAPGKSAVARPKAGTAKATKDAAQAATAKPAARKTAPKTAASRITVRQAGAGTVPAADLQARIQQRAYELWERDGRPDGRDHAYWHQAETEIGARQAAG